MERYQQKEIKKKMKKNAEHDETELLSLGTRKEHTQ